jgi:hypothetical protein
MGRVALGEDGMEWQFTLVIAGRPAARGVVTPEDYRIPLHAQGLDEIRERVRWVRDNDQVIRQWIADRMFELMLDWHDDSTGPSPSKEEFRDKIALSGISIYEDRLPYLTYDDGDFFGGHSIVADLNANNQLKLDPYLFG